MGNKHLIYLLVATTIFLSSSCNKEKNNAEVSPQKLSIKDSIEVLSDSSFFSDVRAMSFHKQDLLFADYRRGDLIRLDKDLNLKSTVGKKGSGPGEIEAPISFYMQNDTIYLFDDRNRKTVMFKDDDFIGEFRHEGFHRFLSNIIVLNNYIYFSGSTEKYSIMSINMQTNETKPFGNIFKFDTPRREHFRNIRILTATENYIYAISDNMPVIERYTIQDNVFVDQLDFSDIPIIKTTIQRKNSDTKEENSYHALANSVYSTPGNIYLLCNTSTASVDFACHTILHFKEKKSKTLELYNIYLLPGDVYRSFCINDKNDLIYAFNSQSSRIETFDIVP